MVWLAHYERRAFMINFSTLCCQSGDIKIQIEESSPEERKLLAEHVVKLLTQGAFVSVVDVNGETFRIFGYDADKNEWLLTQNGKSTKKKPGRKTASGTKATAVAPIAGG